MVVLGKGGICQPPRLLEDHESLSGGGNPSRNGWRSVSHLYGFPGGCRACGDWVTAARVFTVCLYRMYGHPAVRYVRKLVALGDVQGQVTVADLHIGTYRHAFLLSDVLPEAQIKSVDCWHAESESPEEAVADVRDLEVPPRSDPRIQTFQAEHFRVPLPDASCDAVCFGFGTHELPTGGAREKLFNEAIRILKPRGKVLLFEHGWDAHNYVIFGPVIHHVTKRQDWDKFLRERFDHVKYARSTEAVDLFTGVRR